MRKICFCRLTLPFQQTNSRQYQLPVQREILIQVVIHGSILLTERKYNSASKVKSIHRVLIPALVFFIEDIIELSPEIEIFCDLEFQPRIQVKSSIQLTGGAILFEILRSAPCKQVAF